MMKTKVLAVVGPTASGKTALSIAIAKKYNGEIISADSRQLYREMDIGTAKAVRDARREEKNVGQEKRRVRHETRNEKNPESLMTPVSYFMSHAVAHHLVDIKNPDEDYTVSDFKRDAAAAIENIAHRGKLPIIAGGTGLFMSALLDGWELPEVRPDPALRRKLEEEIRTEGLPALFKKLVERDPEAAYIVDPQNPRRVVRALEIALATGRPFSATQRKKESPYESLKLGITKAPELLRARIDARIDEMLKDGLVGEVENLIKKYGARQAPFDAIGYREIIEFLEGKISLEAATALMKKNTWGYARRQMTWFRKDKEIIWVESEAEAMELVEQFID